MTICKSIHIGVCILSAVAVTIGCFSCQSRSKNASLESFDIMMSEMTKSSHGSSPQPGSSLTSTSVQSTVLNYLPLTSICLWHIISEINNEDVLNQLVESCIASFNLNDEDYLRNGSYRDTVSISLDSISRSDEVFLIGMAATRIDLHFSVYEFQEPHDRVIIADVKDRMHSYVLLRLDGLSHDEALTLVKQDRNAWSERSFSGVGGSN